MLQVVNREYLGICIASYSGQFSLSRTGVSTKYLDHLLQDDHPSIKFRPRPDPPLGGSGGPVWGPSVLPAVQDSGFDVLDSAGAGATTYHVRELNQPTKQINKHDWIGAFFLLSAGCDGLD